MNLRITRGTIISDLVALVEKHVCVVAECDHLGQACAECRRPVCRAHSDQCPDCGRVHCEDCGTFHGAYCDRATAQNAGDSDDPIHDHRRNELREVRR